jgi:hypothetical protein
MRISKYLHWDFTLLLNWSSIMTLVVYLWSCCYLVPILLILPKKYFQKYVQQSHHIFYWSVELFLPRWFGMGRRESHFCKHVSISKTCYCALIAGIKKLLIFFFENPNNPLSYTNRCWTTSVPYIRNVLLPYINICLPWTKISQEAEHIKKFHYLSFHQQ